MIFTSKYTLSFHYAWPDRPDHYDLFIYNGDALDTYGLDNISDDCVSIARKKPHRKLYMDYSGPITGNRGYVSVITQGLITKQSEGIYILGNFGILNMNNMIMKLKRRVVKHST